MTMLHTLNKKALIAIMIAATGLPASMAAAQFKVEYSAKADTAKAQADGDKKTVMVYTDHDDEHVYKIKLVNGVIDLVHLDGEELDHKFVELKDNIIVFLTDDGKTLHEIKLHKEHNKPIMPNMPHPPKALYEVHSENDGKHVVKSWSSSSGGNFELKEGSNAFFVAADAPEDGEFVVDFKYATPKVMLGINLGEPSKILRKHLKLKDGMHAILVEDVIDGLPAQAAGLEVFDVIVSIDGSDQASGELLGKILAEKEAGDTMKIIVLRSGDKIKLKVKLAEYNAQALGSSKVVKDFQVKSPDENVFELQILEELEEGAFGNIQGLELEKLKDRLHVQLRELERSGEHREIAIEMRGKAMAAMKDAERQILEFRDGKLFVQNAKELHEHANQLKQGLHQIHEQLPGMNPEALHEHMGGMENRLAQLEDRLNRQMDQMSEQMDRLMSMFERLMDRLED